LETTAADAPNHLLENALQQIVVLWRARADDSAQRDVDHLQQAAVERAAEAPIAALNRANERFLVVRRRTAARGPLGDVCVEGGGELGWGEALDGSHSALK
jgi:hypothetical protein